MLPLLGIATSLIPELVRLIAGDKVGTIANDVVKAVNAVTGSTDPTEVRRKINADPEMEIKLQQALAEVAVAAAKIQNDESDRRRRDDVESIRISIGDIQDARATLLKLAEKQSPFAYGTAMVSVIVAVGFFIVIALAFAFPASMDNNNAAFALIGTMATAFATMISFWLGSSQGSRNKDETVRQLQLVNSEQNSSLLKQAHSQMVQGSSPTQFVQRFGDHRQDRQQSFGSRRFEVCMRVLLTLEGGYTDDPGDPGGPTNYGITRQNLADFHHKPLDEVKVSDIQTLTLEKATEIYRTNYWNMMRCDDLPPGVDLMVFQFGVNAGSSASARVLQGILGVKTDGAIGPDSLNAVRRQDSKLLIGKLSEKQLAYYRALDGWVKYSKGWSSRVAQATYAALQSDTLIE